MASYPKSGNTWIRAFLSNYIANRDSPSDLNQRNSHFANESNTSWYLPLIKGERSELSQHDICQLRPEVHRRIAATSQGTVMVKTHNFLGAYEGLPLHNMSVTSGAIVVVRNPLDVVISLTDHFGLSLEEAILFMSSDATGTPLDDSNVGSVLCSWSTHVDSWTRDQGGKTHVVRYEDLLEKPQKEFAKILGFLGLKRDPPRLKRALKNSSFKNLQAFEQRDGFIERSPSSKRFFRSGRKNQWPGVLSDEQVSRLVSDHGPMMEKFKYLPRSR